MHAPVKILVVEDQVIISAKIAKMLTEIGYEVSGIFMKGEQAIIAVQQNKPDLIIMDIQLKGKLDGIDTAQIIQATHNIPIIFLTANSDRHHFNRAKETKPYAFLSKPFKQVDLQHALELTFQRLAEQAAGGKEEEDSNGSFVLGDRIFFRDNDRMKKLMIQDVLFFEADRNYSKLITSAKTYTLATTLKKIEDRIPSSHFLRVHRSFIVNCAHIDELGELYVMIRKVRIPVSRSLKGQLVERLNII